MKTTFRGDAKLCASTTFCSGRQYVMFRYHSFSLVSSRVGKPAYVSFAKLTFVHDLCVEKLWQQLLEGMQNVAPVQYFGLEDNILCLDFFLSQLEGWKAGLCFIC